MFLQIHGYQRLFTVILSRLVPYLSYRLNRDLLVRNAIVSSVDVV